MVGVVQPRAKAIRTTMLYGPQKAWWRSTRIADGIVPVDSTQLAPAAQPEVATCILVGLLRMDPATAATRPGEVLPACWALRPRPMRVEELRVLGDAHP